MRIFISGAFALIASATALETHGPQPPGELGDCDDYVDSESCWKGGDPNKNNGWPDSFGDYFWKNLPPPGICVTCGHGDDGHASEATECLSCEDGYKIYYFQGDCAGLCLNAEQYEFFTLTGMMPTAAWDFQTRKPRCTPWTQCTGGLDPDSVYPPADRPSKRPTTAKPSYEPSYQPSYQPTSATAQPATPQPVLVPAPSPQPVLPPTPCLDDPSWDSPVGSCSDIAQETNWREKCGVIGSDGRSGFEACQGYCGCQPTDDNDDNKSSCEDDSDWNFVSDSGKQKGCDEVGEIHDGASRCWRKVGEDGRLARDACPVSCEYCSQCTDLPDEQWQWEGADGKEASKGCEWVGSKHTESRCGKQSADGVPASLACPVTCGTCPGERIPAADLHAKHSSSGEDTAWAKRSSSSKDTVASPKRSGEDAVAVRVPTLVAICVLAGIGLGGVATTFLMSKTKVVEEATPLLANKA